MNERILREMSIEDLEDTLKSLAEQEISLDADIADLDKELSQIHERLDSIREELQAPNITPEERKRLRARLSALEELRDDTSESREHLRQQKREISEQIRAISKELTARKLQYAQRTGTSSRVGRMIAAPGRFAVSNAKRTAKDMFRRANPLDKNINRSDTADHGTESLRLAYRTTKKTAQKASTAVSMARNVPRLVRGAGKAVNATFHAVQSVIVHTAAVLISPVTWAIAAVALVLYLIMSLIMMLSAAADQENLARQQAYANPVALGEDMPDEIANALQYFTIAEEREKATFCAKIDMLQYNTADLPHSDTVYLVRNQPLAQYQISLATDLRKSNLKAAWNFGVSAAEGAAIAYVLLERQENESRGTTGVLYPISFTQDVFDTLVPQMYSLTETLYHRQACPSENCSAHVEISENPDYAAAQQAYTDAVTRCDDWNINVVPRSNEYVAALDAYANTPAAGQPYAKQCVDNAYAMFAQAVSNWSLVFGDRRLTIDGQLGANMQTALYNEMIAAQNARDKTPQTVETPYYTCDHLHTLHAFSQQFYDAAETIQMLGFSEEERQWAAQMQLSIARYTEGG